MQPRPTLILSALAFALAACGQSPAPEAPANVPVDTAPASETAAPAPIEAAPTAATTGNKPATVADCATSIEANDAMQFNVDAITIPAS